MSQLSLFGIQIKELIKLPALSELEVVAGFDGLNNTVTNVNIMEVPDISDWLGEGQLVLTTLYSIKDNKEALHDLLPTLHAHGAAGLVIKLRRYIEEFPPYMIEQANKLGFPLIEMPPALSHPIMIEEVYSALAEKQMHVLKLTQTAHTQMMEMVANGGRVHEICMLVSKLFNETVILTDRFQGIRCRADATYSVPLDEDEIKKAIQEIHFASSHKTSDLITLSGFYLIASPVFLGKWRQGDICLLAETDLDIPAKKIMLEHAATIIAMLISHENEIKEVEQRYKNEFLHDWIYGKTATDDMIRERAAQFGWELNISPIMLLINAPDYISNPTISLKERDAARKNVARIITYALGENGINCLIHDGSDNIKVLIPIEKVFSHGKLKTMAKESAELIHSALLNSGINSYISSGYYYPSLSGMETSFQEAAFAMKIGRKFSQSDFYYAYGDQKLYGFLDTISGATADYYINKYYLPIKQYDTAHKAQLVNTIKAYVRYQGNTSKISKKLFTHYNTIRYRLEKINDITGLNIYDADDSILLYFSIILGESELTDSKIS